MTTATEQQLRGHVEAAADAAAIHAKFRLAAVLRETLPAATVDEIERLLFDLKHSLDFVPARVLSGAARTPETLTAAGIWRQALLWPPLQRYPFERPPRET